jgi:iron-sulfur cluster repair protein YtfE (RIC family)
MNSAAGPDDRSPQHQMALPEGVNHVASLTSDLDTATGVIPRPHDEPAPDITDYRVVHRAMTIDLDRLAVAAAELVEHHDNRRLRAFRRYLRGVSHEIESHHHVEDEHVWPVVAAAAGAHAALVALTEEHEHLDPLLHRASALVSRPRATSELASVLREIADLLARHVEHEERDLFPLLEEFVRVEDYTHLQERFRSNLRPRMLPFVLPWAVRHATPAERTAMVGEAPWPLRLILSLFEPGFRSQEAVLFP